MESLEKRIRRIEKEIDSRVVPCKEAVQLWESVLGVNHVSGCNLVAEVGVNMAQFPSAQQLASWAAACPGNNQSAGKRISGTTRGGEQVAAPDALSGRLGGNAEEGLLSVGSIQTLGGSPDVKRAGMAVAHTMLVIGYTMLKTGRIYHELGGGYLEQINKDQLQRYFVKRLQGLGLTVAVAPAA